MSREEECISNFCREEFIENAPDEDFFLVNIGSEEDHSLLDENERLKEENYKLQARADKYKCRIDKAIEYIGQNTTENDEDYRFCMKLLEILEGRY